MRVLPQHPQHYPTQLLTHRIEEYVLDDGAPPTQNRANAHRVTGQQVFDAVIAAQAATGLANIDARYYVGTCFHEAGCVNEWDTEIATMSSPAGFVSVGAFQIGDEEARRFGFKLEDMLDLEKSAECMIHLAEYNRGKIRAAAKLAPSAEDPDYTDGAGRVWKAGTMRAYLAIAHNHGTGFASADIAAHGLNWGSYKTRRPADNIVGHGYGEDCITGGSYWPGTTPVLKLGDRVLMLTDPLTHGDDVVELQRHLKLVTDGTFGPLTDKAVRAFQAQHNLVADGKVGALTAAALLVSD